MMSSSILSSAQLLQLLGILLCLLPGLVLIISGWVLVLLSSWRTWQAAGGLASVAAGAGGLDAALHAVIHPLWLALPMAASAAAVIWLFWLPHQRPALQRWTVSGRVPLDDFAPLHD